MISIFPYDKNFDLCRIRKCMRELLLKIDSRVCRAFLQGGFHATKSTSRLHKHSYAEIHVFSGGGSVRVEGEDIELTAQDAIAIPAGRYHRLTPLENTQRISFQIDAPCSEIRHTGLPRGVLEALFSATNEAEADGDLAMLSACMGLVATAVLGTRYEGSTLCDYPLLIREFFSRRYSEDVHLSDLAGELHLSERQTERLVEKHTGRSFRDELTATRMAVADQLIAEGELSLSEIAAYVGYHSYAGFYKAIKRRP